MVVSRSRVSGFLRKSLAKHSVSVEHYIGPWTPNRTDGCDRSGFTSVGAFWKEQHQGHAPYSKSCIYNVLSLREDTHLSAVSVVI
jgi:hypothetical protein